MLHDGSWVRLRKVAEDYDPTDRDRAYAYIRERQSDGEVVTGLLYISPDSRDVHEQNDTVPDAADRQLPYERSLPGQRRARQAAGAVPLTAVGGPAGRSCGTIPPPWGSRGAEGCPGRGVLSKSAGWPWIASSRWWPGPRWSGGARATTQAPADTRMLRMPTVSATQIAFAYANNIWIVERAGGTGAAADELPGPDDQPAASRLTARRSPSAREYAGNVDVYVVPAEGGEPKRLTWHPGRRQRPGLDARRQGVVCSRRRRATGAPSGAPRFWTVPAAGGVEEPMALPRAYQGKISPDGTHIAYRMNNSWDDERRNYRGGQNRPIWIVDLKTFDLVSPPWTDSKDIDPVWVGDTVYFLSDRDGVSNVWSFDTKAKKLAQVTKFTDFDVKTIDAGGGAVVFEQAGVIHELDREVRQGNGRAASRANGDFPWMMPRWEDVTGADVESRPLARPASASSSKRAARSSRSRRKRATSAT